MNEQDYKKLCEIAWRRRLTPEEEAQLSAHLAVVPGLRTDWEDEVALSQTLRQLPNVSVPSNFTALVLQAVEQDRRAADRKTAPSSPGRRHWHAWMPRLAWGVIPVAVGVAGFLHFRPMTPRDMARQISPMTEVLATPAPDVWENFEEINQMRQIAAVSDEALIEFLR